MEQQRHFREQNSLPDIILYTFTLTILHFTFSFLVRHQYAEKAPQSMEVLWDSTVVSSTPWLLLGLVALLHPRSARPITQMVFVVLSIASGAYLVHISNTQGYLATMQRAPPLGTIWIWSALELHWEWSLASLGVVLIWAYFQGFSMF